MPFGFFSLVIFFMDGDTLDVEEARKASLREIRKNTLDKEIADLKNSLFFRQKELSELCRDKDYDRVIIPSWIELVRKEVEE